MQVTKETLFAAASNPFLEDIGLVPSLLRFKQQHVKLATKLYLAQQKCAPVYVLSGSVCPAKHPVPSLLRLQQQHVKLATKLYLAQQKCAACSELSLSDDGAGTAGGLQLCTYCCMPAIKLCPARKKGVSCSTAAPSADACSSP